ncbi:hypothetical protein BUALT_Bualt04G0122500 [Buddleja alternifolia]|uniref:TF-B3 domain-containing protein n=1 Tax=Buddleja alternifolia TaxID=168488 RepID=A0AAV6XVS0_9LAMI|nr:hypothetical protein BUALT_Bualt04G0122500 [Buddleja alternifolia]
MGRKLKDQPSFFKILITENYYRKLRLPSFFVEQYRNILPEDAKFRISSGETWDVRLERMDDDDYYFTQGWKKFTKDSELKRFEFLVFWFNRKSTFEVSSYGLHGCENELVPYNACDDISNQRSKSGVANEEGSQPYFEMLLKKHHRYRLTLPRKFVVAAGLMEEETVKLEYLPAVVAAGYEEVTLDQRYPKRTDMATGWREFREANGVVIGNRYSFKFSPGKNVIRVKGINVQNTSSGVGNKRSRAHIDECSSMISLIPDENEISNKKAKYRIAGEEGRSPLYFEILLKQHHQSRVTLPRKFTEAAGLIKEEIVELEYLPAHRHQEVRLDHRHQYRTDMAKGWTKFREANGLAFSKIYSFEYKPGKNVIQVKEVKVQNGSGLSEKRARTRNEAAWIDEETKPDISPKFTSNVSTYGINGCENELLADNARDGVSSKRSKFHIADEEGRPLYFENLLKQQHKSRMTLPSKFIRAAGLMEEETVQLVYLPNHRHQEVTLTHGRNYTTHEMAAGWSKFCETNGLDFGKSYSFEFNPRRNVIQVKEVKAHTNSSGLGNIRSITSVVEDEDISNPHFEIVLKIHQRSRVCVPKHFAEATGLINKNIVEVEYRGGRRVKVELVRRPKQPLLLEMASGWGQFRKVNNLDYEKRYLFEFIPSKQVIQVKERLPPQFMKDHGENLSEKAKLHVESEELHSPWIVKIERVGQWHFFTDGWTRFARDIDLKFREFLLFKLVGESTFEVSAYDISGCEKELYSVPRTYTQADDQTNHGSTNLGQRAKNSKKKAENENEDVTNDQTDGEILSLVKKLTKADAFELKIPRGLAMSTGIVRNKKLKLKYGKGQKWPIYVSAKQCGKFAITWGWNEFLTGNKMVIGSMISLEFVGNEIEAKVLKKGINAALSKNPLLPSMDSLIQLLLILTSSLCTFLVFIYYYQFWNGKTNTAQLPRAGGALPIIGHLHLFSSKQLVRKTLGSMTDKNGLAFTIRLGSQENFVISSWEMAKECFTTHDKVFSDRPKITAAKILGYNFAMLGLAPYGSYWREMPKIVTLELLSHRRIDMLHHIRASEVQTSLEELYNLWVDRKSHQNGLLVDMKKWFGDLTLNAAVRMVGGKSFV